MMPALKCAADRVAGDSPLTGKLLFERVNVEDMNAAVTAHRSLLALCASSSHRNACDERGCGRLMCRLCHCFSQGDSDDAARWLMGSVDANCCGAYAVCHIRARA